MQGGGRGVNRFPLEYQSHSYEMKRSDLYGYNAMAYPDVKSGAWHFLSML
jgi:hypothetical protein